MRLVKTKAECCLCEVCALWYCCIAATCLYSHQHSIRCCCRRNCLYHGDASDNYHKHTFLSDPWFIWLEKWTHGHLSLEKSNMELLKWAENHSLSSLITITGNWYYSQRCIVADIRSILCNRTMTPNTAANAQQHGQKKVKVLQWSSQSPDGTMIIKTVVGL